MSCTLKTSLYAPSGFNEAIQSSKKSESLGFCTSSSASQFQQSKIKTLPVLSNDFTGQPVVVPDQNGSKDWSSKSSNKFSIRAQASICVSRALRWWEKTLKPNMVEIHSATELVDSLLNAGDRLVAVDFYSPGCGGCKALHPKICQLAESNPNAIFLKVNYEELRTMCHSLRIHVLPFFRFYRGAEGRVCSFSCTNATIKKFKDALAKHGVDRCSLGPAKASRFDKQPLSPAQEQQIVQARQVDKQERRWQYLLTSDLLHRAGFIKSPYVTYPSFMAPKKRSVVAQIARSGTPKGRALARTGSGPRPGDSQEREARLLSTLGPVPPPKDIPSPARTEIIPASAQKRKDAPSSSAALETAGDRPSKQQKGAKGITQTSPVRLSMKRFREQMNEVIPDSWYERFPTWDRSKRRTLRKQYQYQAALLTAIEAEDDENEIVDLREAKDMLKGQVDSLQLQLDDVQKKHKDEVDTLQAEKESSESSLKSDIARKESENRRLLARVRELEKSEADLKQKVVDPKIVLDRFRRTRYWRKRLEIERQFGCMQYRRCCINAGVDLRPLEGDAYDPNEEDPEPVDDTIDLYLDVLEEDTLQLHTSDEESADEEEVPMVNPPARTDGENTAGAPDQGQATDENLPQAALATENPPVPSVTEDAPDPSPPAPSESLPTPAA